jgi:hypothetical protein
MSAGVINYHLQQMLANGFADQLDPGASGTLGIDLKGVAKFEVVTAGAESRALEAATRHPVGAVCIVVAKTLVGALTITGAASGNEVLSANGDMAVFMVTDANGTKEWRFVFGGQHDALEDSVAALLVDVQGTFVVDIPVSRWRIWDSLDAQLGATPTSADDLAHIVGTFLTDSPYITTTAQTPGDATPVASYCRYLVQVPENYQDGDALTLRVTWARPDAAATSMALDAEVVRTSAPTVDVNSTAAVNINAAASGTANFVLTPTNIVAGETLNVRLNITAVSNGASYEGRITNVALVYVV